MPTQTTGQMKAGNLGMFIDLLVELQAEGALSEKDLSMVAVRMHPFYAEPENCYELFLDVKRAVEQRLEELNGHQSDLATADTERYESILDAVNKALVPLVRIYGSREDRLAA